MRSGSMKVHAKGWMPALAGAVTGFLCLLVLSGGDARVRGAPHAYIVQARSAAEAGRAVAQAGGQVQSELSVIHAVSALLDEGELAALRRASVPLLEIYDDAQVQATSQGPPETYYPSEIGAQQLQVGGTVGTGVTVAVVDSGLWSQHGPDLSAPGQAASRI